MIPAGLCQCGCGARTSRNTYDHHPRGIKKGDYAKWIPEHRGRRPLGERMNNYTAEDRGHATPCWIWQGAKNDRGYGTMTVEGTHRYVHRLSYERSVGPIPDGLVVDHLCRVPSCLNPEHLEPVTHAENCRRGARAKLTFEQVREIRASSKSQVELARVYGVCDRTIWQVLHGVNWQEAEAA